MNIEDLEKLQEIIRLHDEALTHALKKDSCHKSSEGQVTVHFTNYFDDERETNPLAVKQVEIFSYVLGVNGRNHYFDTIDETLKTVSKWHELEINS